MYVSTIILHMSSYYHYSVVQVNAPGLLPGYIGPSIALA